MNELNTLIKDVERDLVVKLVLGVKYGRIDLKEARNIAREFMAEHPYKNKEDLFEQLYIMSEKYNQVRKVYVKHVFEFEDEKRQNRLEIMRNYMKNNEYKNAVNVAKGGD